MQMALPTAGDSVAPNCWSIDHDNREWLAQGKSFTLHQHDRTYAETRRSASASDFYNTDQSSKMSIGHRVQRSPYRYVAMRQQSGGRSSLAATGMSERVGPGAYSPHSFVHPRHAPYGSAFASGVPREGLGVLQQKQPVEPGYASLSVDRRQWTLHENREVSTPRHPSLAAALSNTPCCRPSHTPRCPHPSTPRRARGGRSRRGCAGRARRARAPTGPPRRRRPARARTPGCTRTRPPASWARAGASTTTRRWASQSVDRARRARYRARGLERSGEQHRCMYARLAPRWRLAILSAVKS